MKIKMGLGLMLLAVGVFASAANALPLYAEAYEMGVRPDLAGGAYNGNLMEAATGGSGTNGPSGFEMWLDDDNNGIGTFLDNASSSGNQGLRLNNAAFLLGTAGYTADFKIRWLAGATGTADMKSLGFAGSQDGINARGRALTLYDNRIEYRGNGFYGSTSMDTSQWMTLRVIVQPDGNQTLYSYGDWTALMSPSGVGGTGVNGAITSGLGFFLGSWGGSSTTLTNFDIDYLRVVPGTVVDQQYDIPEPASLILLVLGAAPLLRRRR